jgi:hypothetical protein
VRRSWNADNRRRPERLSASFNSEAGDYGRPRLLVSLRIRLVCQKANLSKALSDRGDQAASVQIGDDGLKNDYSNGMMKMGSPLPASQHAIVICLLNLVAGSREIEVANC